MSIVFGRAAWLLPRIRPTHKLMEEHIMSIVNSGSHNDKPGKLIVTLQIGGAFFAIANIVCVAILAWTYLSVKLEPRTLEVKGSAKKLIESDLITWRASIVARDPDLTKAYDKIKADSDKVIAFLKKAGVPEKEIVLSALETSRIFQREAIPSPKADTAPTIVTTNKVENYVLSQQIVIESKSMEIVPEVSRSVTNLIKDGVEIESSQPQYRYTQMAELKLSMIADATKDATSRATQIVTNANGTLGKLVEARLGVMQINPKGSSATSGEGNNDVSSYEKEITAVVAVTFQLN